MRFDREARFLILLTATALAGCTEANRCNESNAGCDAVGAGGAGGTAGAGGAGGTAGSGGSGASGGAGGSSGPGLLIGDEEGNVSFTVIADKAYGLDVPRDLGFHPGRTGELWISNRADDSTTIVFDATGAAVDFENRRDGFALHFMEEVSSLAFGAQNFRDDWSFGTCQESENTYNDTYAPNNFMGPALWSAHLDVFAISDPEGLGSHLDMLHHSPNCMGIAHDNENVYWVFDGYHSQIARYDFQKDHGPGYDDHSDGIMYFFDEPRVKRVPDVPSHMVLDKETGILYVADTGNARVIRFDTATGEKKQKQSVKEPGTIVELWTGASWSDLVPASSGLLLLPSGIAFHEGVVYVGDNATGEILAFDPEGELLGRLATGLPAGGLMGIEPGPDDRLYITDAIGARILRIELAAN